MDKNSDTGGDPVEEYFVDVIRGAKRRSIREANPSNIVEETVRKESIVGKRAVRALGDGFDRRVKGLTKGLIESVTDSVIERQRNPLFECAAKKSRNELSSEEFESYQKDFVNAVSPWISRLNPEARGNLENALYEGFEEVVEDAAFLMRFEGDDFDEVVRNAPQREVEERFDSLVGYISSVGDAFESSNEVYVEKKFNVPLRSIEVRLHFRREAVRVLNEVETYIENRVEKTLVEAYEV